MTTVKFCGLTRAVDAAFAQEVGATHGGVVLAPSARQVTAAEADRIFAAAPRLKRVGVFRHRDADGILDDAVTAGLQVLQLHGAFSGDELEALRGRFEGDLWVVVPVDSIDPRVQGMEAGASTIADAILLDTSVSGTSGGTGVPFEWSAMRGFATTLSDRQQLVVAGGLTPGNVGVMIRALGPSIADVSSGVESSPGIKDHILMAAFAEAVASASIL